MTVNKKYPTLTINLLFRINPVVICLLTNDNTEMASIQIKPLSSFQRSFDKLILYEYTIKSHITVKRHRLGIHVLIIRKDHEERISLLSAFGWCYPTCKSAGQWTRKKFRH